MSEADVVKRDDRGGPLVFDDETSRHDDAPENATIIDEPLGEEVASKLRALRQQLARKESEVEKTAFVGAPTFDEEEFPRLGDHDDQPTVWDAAVRLEGATDTEPLPVASATKKPAPPPEAEASAEYTRKEPIPMELFFETAEPVAVPPSSRPPPPSFTRPKSAEKSIPIEAPSEPAEQTMLDVAAAVGLPPEVALRLPEEETFEEGVLDGEDQQKEPARLPLPIAPADLDLTPFVEEEQSKPRKTPRAGIAGDDIRRYAEAASTTSKVIPLILASFVVVATLYVMIGLYHSTVETRDEHVELRFLSTFRGKSTQLVAREGATMSRFYIETVPPDLLVLHNREILGKTPLTIDLPIELRGEIGIELSSPYYQTWVKQVGREAESNEYRIRAELTKK